MTQLLSDLNNACNDENKNVFIRFMHGLGDSIQFEIVLAHIKKYKPNWHVEISSRECYKDLYVDYPETLTKYDLYFRVLFSAGMYQPQWHDLPLTKVTRCLEREFKITPDISLYDIKMPVLNSYSYINILNEHYILIHPHGITSQNRKNMTDDEIIVLADKINDLGVLPVILDFNDRCVHLPYTRITIPFSIPTLNCIIRNAKMVIGIDSGVEHYAPTLGIPTVIIWKKWFPLHNIEPNPLLINWITLDTFNYFEGEPTPDKFDYFFEHYNPRFYNSITDITIGI